MQQIGEGIYVETDYRGGNVGFVVTGEGVILINTPMIPHEARHWRDEIARVTEQKIIYIINTDYHPECVLGNRVFQAPVIAHELAWRRMRSYGDSFRQRLVDSFRDEPEIAAQFKGLRITLPRITLTQRMNLHKGSKELRLIHVGGHTPASIIVHIPTDGVLFTGDIVVNDMHPIMHEADSKEWLDALTYIRRPWVKADIIVPGEGEICDKAITKKLSTYIRRLRAKVRGAYWTGQSRAQLLSSVAELLDFFPTTDKEEAKRRWKDNVERVYEEIKASKG